MFAPRPLCFRHVITDFGERLKDEELITDPPSPPFLPLPLPTTPGYPGGTPGDPGGLRGIPGLANDEKPPKLAIMMDPWPEGTT